MLKHGFYISRIYERVRAMRCNAFINTMEAAFQNFNFEPRREIHMEK
jgi:hypothetical protein